VEILRFGKLCRYFTIESVYKIHINIFLVCKYESHFTVIFVRELTAAVEYNNKTQNEGVTVALVCYTTVALNSTTAINHTIFYGILIFKWSAERDILQVGAGIFQW
jgi:hypothetical protein